MSKVNCAPQAPTSQLASRTSRFPWVGLAVVALVAGLAAVGVILGLLHQQQQRLNRSLALALGAEDETRALELLRQGASVKVIGGNGRTCVGLGARSPSTELLREALNRGGSPKWNAAAQEHPLNLAVRAGRPDNVRLLLQHGGNVNATGREGGTTSMFAIESPRSAAVLRVLLQWKPNLDATDAEGRTALMLAVAFLEPECVALLLQAGADPTLRDRQGRTALDLAHRHEREFRVLARQIPGFRKAAADSRRIVATLSAFKAGQSR